MTDFLKQAQEEAAKPQITYFIAKEMGVVRQAKEMSSPKVGEIPVRSHNTRKTLLPLKKTSLLTPAIVLRFCFAFLFCSGRVYR